MVFVYNNYIHQSYIIKIIYTSYYKFDYLYILQKIIDYLYYGVYALLVPIFLACFHFCSYIFISLLLVPKLINACYFNHFCQSTYRNS